MAEFSEEIASIETSRIREGRDTITSVMSEAFPNSKWQAGDQLEGIVAEPIALGFAFSEYRLDLQEQSLSLAAVAEDPDLADDDLVDRLLSNYFIERQEATVAFGSILVVVNRATIIPVSNGAAFSANSQTYVTTRSWRVFPPGTREEDPDNGVLVLEARSDGNYQFTLPVQSENTGPETLLARGAVLTATTPFPGQVSVTAASDFGGGLAADTNADLVARAQEGITPKVLSGYQQIEQTIENAFPGSLARVVGAGNALLSRDRDNLFAVSTGGKADLYVRTEPYPRLETLSITAQLSPEDRSARRWRFSYSLPGAYYVQAIRIPDSALGGGIVPEKETVSVKPPTTGFVPKLRAADVAFTAHQQRTVTFIDNETDFDALLAGAGATDVISKEWDVDVLAMPFIEDIDIFVRDRERRDPALDLLAKAACPVLVSARIIVRGTVDEDAAKAALVQAIADLPADTDTIPANLAYDAIREHVTGTVGTVYYSALVVGQDLSQQLITGRLELTIPEDVAKGLGVDSCAFMVRAEDISIEEV